MAVEVGDEAPDFELKDQHGNPVRLSGFRGSKNVVLVFYPLAFSGVCTASCARCATSSPKSPGTTSSCWRFRWTRCSCCGRGPRRDHFDFTLLADFWPHGEVAKAYGVFDDKMGVATRGTFIIDKDGVVRWKVVNPIPQAREIADYQKALAELG